MPCFVPLLARVADACQKGVQRVESPTLGVKRFTYSATYADASDLVTLETKGRIDALCRVLSHHVALPGHTVRLMFSGAPCLYVKLSPVLTTASGQVIANARQQVYSK